MSLELKVVDLGTIGFKELESVQERLARERLGGTISDTLLIAQHPPTITKGHSSLDRNIVHVSEPELNALGITLLESRRAGGSTYLGPGQLGFYPVFHLGNLGITPYEFLRTMERAAHHVTTNMGIDTYLGTVHNPKLGRDYHSVWYTNNKKPHKFFAIGIHTIGGFNGVIDNGGFSVCLNPEGYKHFRLIDHCGFKLSDVGITSFKEMLGYDPSTDIVKEKFVRAIASTLRYSTISDSKKDEVLRYAAA